MKKNLIIIILILACAFSMFYAYIKSNQATLAGRQIQDLKQLADDQKMEAEKQAELAQASAKEAIRLEALSLELTERLSACESK